MPAPAETTSNTKIVVDLSGLSLTPAQIEAIGAAVHSTALRELAGLPDHTPNPIALIPRLRDPRWIGLVASDLSKFDVQAAAIDKAVKAVTL